MQRMLKEYLDTLPVHACRTFSQSSGRKVVIKKVTPMIYGLGILGPKNTRTASTLPAEYWTSTNPGNMYAIGYNSGTVANIIIERKAELVQPTTANSSPVRNSNRKRKRN